MTFRWLLPLMLLLVAWPVQAQDEAPPEEGDDPAEEAAEAPPGQQVSFPVALGSLAPPPLPDGLLEPGDQPVKVMLQLVVDEDGGVVDVQLKESCGIEEVDDAAIEAGFYLAFYPAQTADGTPVEVTIDYPFFFLRPEPPPPAVPPARLSGRIEIKGDKNPLPAAFLELYVATPKEEFKEDAKKLERPENWELADEAAYTTETDTDGNFVIDDIKPGTYIAAFGGGAYRLEKFIEELGEGVLREVIYRARPTGLNESTTVVRRTSDTPSRVLTQQELRKMPGAGGDPIAAMQSLPGVIHQSPVQAGGFAGTNQAPIIRGAASEDSVLYMDGLPVPILLHSITNKTVTGDYILDQAYLRPAAPEARFGDLTGGVLGIELRNPRNDRVGGFVDNGIGESGGAIEGPIGTNKKARFYVGVRRTYYDLIIRLVYPQAERLQLTTAPFAQDQQAILEFDVTDWLTGHFSYIGTLDGIRVVDTGDEDEEERGLFDTRTDMHRFTLRGDFRLGKNKKIKNRGGVALTFWGTGFNALDIISRSERHTTFHVFDDLNLPITNWLQLDAGFLVEIDNIRLSENLPPLSREDTGPSTSTGQEQNVVGSGANTRGWAGAYVGLPITPIKGITIAPEFRLDWRNDLAQVMPQFRARMGFQPVEQFRVSLAGGRYLQSPSSEELSSISGNPKLGPEGAWHVNLALDIQPGTFLNVNLQGYAKFLDNQTVSSRTSGDAAAFADLGFDFSDPDDDDPTNGLSNSGIGRIWGAELFTRWNLFPGGRLVGWLGYGISWAQRRDFETEEWRYFQNDRRHQLTAVLQARFPGEISLGARFQIQSGSPTTPVEKATYFADINTFVPTYGTLYSARTKPFHQLDLRLDKKIRNKNTTAEVFFDVTNVYAAVTGDFVFYDFEYEEELTFQTFPNLNVGVRVEF